MAKLTSIPYKRKPKAITSIQEVDPNYREKMRHNFSTSIQLRALLTSHIANLDPNDPDLDKDPNRWKLGLYDAAKYFQEHRPDLHIRASYGDEVEPDGTPTNSYYLAIDKPDHRQNEDFTKEFIELVLEATTQDDYPMVILYYPLETYVLFNIRYSI